ncbi:4-hydroxyphenylacetate 3-monooxygenase, reductase component [Paraburkholderia aromaticivorans]|uniref:4-hydroxyphenylacetate 3-monooxygenase reductase component n=1 Tax=Paraburkholderia aromaticivorans TaxID=2026199 RepID=A0A248VUU5_9BURK|nr:4-hydroxyphenylacetate 3-monooxygenase, reductase component [Paraburkholderia aromaticivorans]ASW02653.1 4-hydroxyphenylacetate 3-monooxygenase, reductase component [Paraburkholderia aromaticivorans]
MQKEENVTIDDTRKRFRDAMACLPAAVNIITTNGPGGRCGITASAVCSVTDAPPTMLVCINQASYVHDVLHRNRSVCINVLAAECQELARDFAGMTACSMDERFERHAWTGGASSAPVLADAIVSLEGAIVDIKTVGSHSVMFAQIRHIALRQDGDGLIYFGRQFHRLARPPAAAPVAAQATR